MRGLRLDVILVGKDIKIAGRSNLLQRCKVEHMKDFSEYVSKKLEAPQLVAKEPEPEVVEEKVAE